MTINFIGNFKQGPGGEPADETHMASELEALGHIVHKVPRDVWKAYVEGYEPQEDWLLPKEADINIICKWHHFVDGKYISRLKKISNAPVFYFVWDPMLDDADMEQEIGQEPSWHIKMGRQADLYLSGELGRASYYRKEGVRFYYFQFDSVSKEFHPVQEPIEQAKKYDVIFTGSSANKRGRLDLLKKINQQVPIQVFGYDQMEWIKHGFKCEPAVYGDAYNQVVADSKIVLGLSYDPHCFGYWSNRVGKVLQAGGFLLQQYAPGMELVLADSCAYFQSADEAVIKIKEYLAIPSRRRDIQRNNFLMNRSRWTSQYKMRQLVVLIKRFLREENGKDWILP